MVSVPHRSLAQASASRPSWCTRRGRSVRMGQALAGVFVLAVLSSGCGSEQDNDRKIKNAPAPSPSPQPRNSGEGDAKARKPVQIGIPSTIPGQPGTCVGPMGLELLLDPGTSGEPQTYVVGRLDTACYDRKRIIVRMNLSAGARLSAALVCSRITNSTFNFECQGDTSAFLADNAIVIPIALSDQSAANFKAELELPAPQ